MYIVGHEWMITNQHLSIIQRYNSDSHLKLLNKRQNNYWVTGKKNCIYRTNFLNWFPGQRTSRILKGHVRPLALRPDKPLFGPFLSLEFPFIYVNRVRLCLWTAATKGRIVLSPDDIWVWSPGGMILTGETRKTRRKTCPSATLSTTNPTWTEPGENPGLRCGWPATNRLSTARNTLTGQANCCEPTFKVHIKNPSDPCA
jgi:hypothetical protein